VIQTLPIKTHIAPFCLFFSDWVAVNQSWACAILVHTQLAATASFDLSQGNNDPDDYNSTSNHSRFKYPIILTRRFTWDSAGFVELG
jgi:hypothetical protein